MNKSIEELQKRISELEIEVERLNKFEKAIIWMAHTIKNTKTYGYATCFKLLDTALIYTTKKGVLDYINEE